MSSGVLDLEDVTEARAFALAMVAYMKLSAPEQLGQFLNILKNTTEGIPGWLGDWLGEEG